MKKLLCVLVFLPIGFLTGCASILGSGKDVELSAEPVNSTVTVYNRNGTAIETVTTPDKISFKKAENYSFEFNQTDYMSQTISVRRKFNHSYWLNFLFAGIGVSSHMFLYPYNEFSLDAYKLAGYGLGAIGLIGVFSDIITGSVVGVTPEKVNVSLRLTPEAATRQETQRQEELARQNALRKANAEEQQRATEARRQAQEQARKAEQERLANLYRQAGNNFGNLRNTSRRYGRTFGNDYLTTIYNFGDGNYIKEIQSALGWGIFGSPSPETGTYRVNADTVIFLSSKGEYEAGTIIGTALNIGGDIYR